MNPEESNSIQCPSCKFRNKDTNRFCEACGTELIPTKLRICQYCLQPIAQTAVFCPLCGKGAEHESSDPNNSAAKTPKNKRVRLIIDLIVLAVIVVGVLGIIRYEAKSRYVSEIQAYMKLCDKAVDNLDEITDTIQDEWKSCSEGNYDGDVQKAIDEACIIREKEFNEAIKMADKLEASYKKIRAPSVFISDKETLEIRDAAKELYNCYLDYYSFVGDFRCTYYEFAETKSEFKKDFKSKHNELKSLL